MTLFECKRYVFLAPAALLPPTTRWPYAQTATTMTELGCKHVNKNVGEVHVDVKNKLVTTSAFMCNAPIHEVFDGVGVMVTELLKLA
jgi:enhancing lycopene biosynthesis protein 2